MTGKRHEEFLVQLMKDHAISLVAHRYDVGSLSVRRAALPFAMPPNRLEEREHYANPPSEALAPHGRLFPHLVKHSRQ
jgi:hypothetical protein